jgi:enamine deaminase RidA (YjgF/YER057c/UK114 family)
MSAQPVNPPQIAAPLGAYSQGVLVTGSGRWLHIAGQVGVRPDGSLAASAAEQTRVAWANLVEVLREAGMDASHLVRINTYVTDEAHLTEIASVRLGLLGDARPASTLVVVKALARPQWLVEIDATAFKE